MSVARVIPNMCHLLLQSYTKRVNFMQRELCTKEERWAVVDALAEDGLLIIHAESTLVYPRQRVYVRYKKRVFDVISVFIALAINALVNLALLVGAFTDMRNSVLFKRKRVRKSGELFTAPMYVDLALSDVDCISPIARRCVL